MKLSKLRVEHDVKMRDKTCARVICNIQTKYTDTNELYFWVDEEYASFLTSDVYDAFLVAVLYPAMHYGEDIEIEGNVSKKLYFNIVNYVLAVVRDYAILTKKHFKPVSIKVKGFADAQKNEQLHVGTGFSGGIDSFSTLVDRFYKEKDPDYKIDTLFFFHVGQYGKVTNPLSWERANNRFTITHDYGKLIGLPAIMMNTNLFDFYQPEWEYSGGLLIRCASVLVFQKALKRYYISNTTTYGERVSTVSSMPSPDMAEFADPIIMPLLSPVGLDIIDDGEQNFRTIKTARIIDNAHAQQFLNVCVNSSDNHLDATNCSLCSKCLRTLFALDSLDALEKFKKVFNLEIWRKKAFGYKCHCITMYSKDPFARDNIDFARRMEKKLPSNFVAYTYVYSLKVLRLPKRIINKLRNL